MKHISIYVVVIIAFFSFTQKIYGISNIIVENNTLIPYFSENITNYNVFVSSETESINVSTTNDETDDYVSGFGNIVLKDGKNEIVLNVVKKTGEVFNYKINIFKNYKENLDYGNSLLKSLKIEGYDINFDPSTFEYKINIEDINELDIKYETMSEYSVVKMIGNNNLKPGNNTIKITVTSKDNTKSIYVINVNKLVSVFEESSSKKKEINILGKDKLTKKETNIITLVIISIGVIVISLIFFLMFGVKKKH